MLFVVPGSPAAWPELRQQIRRLRRPQDKFVYEPVMVGSLEDAMVSVVANPNIEAVVHMTGFRSNPSTRCRSCTNTSPASWVRATFSQGDHGTLLARIVKGIRPELDVYLLTDRNVEQLAGSDELACIRRIFYQVEERLEIHLSILEGIADRYDTPYFDNLQKYAQRPIGTFHALPIARGKAIFKSNWIRDMGQFYGPNLFLAESSATTGGLDSLLEPTGNIKVAQEKAARAFGADRAFFVTNGTSTSNKIVEQGLLKPGDIVLVDRNCHKSHHYGMVLAGAQPYYLEAYPMMEYSMYGGVPLRAIKQALLALKAEGKLDAARMVLLTNCTFDGHVYHAKRVMEECLAIKPDLVFLWDEAWFGFAHFSPYLRRRTAMGAAAALQRNSAIRTTASATRPSGRRSASWIRQTPAPGHAAAAGSRQGAAAHLPDELDAQVDVGAPARIDDPRLRPGLAHGRGAVPRGILYAYLDITKPPDHRLAGRGAAPDGARGL